MRRLFSVFIISIFLSLNYGILLYVNSSFLRTFFSERAVSLVFLLSAVTGIFSFFFAPRIINSLGKEKSLLLILLATLLSNLLIAASGTGVSAALFFISYATFSPLSYYCLDIFIEEASLDGTTGEMRGIYLTFVNAGILLGPLVVALTAAGEVLRPFYLAAAAALLVPVFLASFLLHKAKKMHPVREHSFSIPFKSWWKSRNVRAVTLSRLSLATFFGIMILYTPIYLHETIGFDWSELGIVFTVMLLPFILFEWPVGELADRLWGEKELMSIGFFIMGITLLVMPFLGDSLAVWATILFLSRVGASIVEITTESYFFKKIKAHEIGFLSIFRLVGPVSLILGSILGALTLTLFSLNAVFFAGALIVLWGLYESLYLEDTL